MRGKGRKRAMEGKNKVIENKRATRKGGRHLDVIIIKKLTKNIEFLCQKLVGKIDGRV